MNKYKPINVTLDDETINAAEVLGEGNVSKGLREAIKIALRQAQRRSMFAAKKARAVTP